MNTIHALVAVYLLCLIKTTTANVGTACTDDASCGNNEFCNVDKCACNVNYEGADGAVCVQKVCTAAANCSQWANSDCQGAADPKHCACGVAYAADKGECKANGVDAECTSGADVCGAMTSGQCKDNKCACKTLYTVKSDDNTMCEMTTCAADGDCTSADPNAACQTATPRVCKCKDAYMANSGTGVCDQRVIDSPCTSDAQCTGVTDGKCTANKCACKAGYSGTGTDCTEVLGRNCAGNPDCTGTPNAVCTDDKCSCNTGYQASNKVCVMDNGAGGMALSMALMLLAIMFTIFA